ncbi:conserved hypothetical protein [Elizabethkingia anophelis]|nr:conserved hypothetical protein [Elizabethkingia anophelis]
MCYITKISKIESNSQRVIIKMMERYSCVISQRYPKLKAIHNCVTILAIMGVVVLYHKDIQN